MIRWSPLAIDRVAEIGEWIATDHPDAALRIVDGIFAAVERLAEFPMSGRQVPEFERLDLREIIFEQFRIVYRVSAGQVDLLS
jgi:toxin ParE1/3/4